MPGLGKLLAAALMVAVWTLALLVEVGALQDNLISDVSQAGQEQYMTLTTGDSVTVTGTAAQGTDHHANEGRAPSQEESGRDR